jgi:predicted transcriptional regulator
MKKGKQCNAVYRRILEPKLNNERNTFVVIQAEQIKNKLKCWSKMDVNIKKQIENCDRQIWRLKKQIKKIWEAEWKEYLIDKIWTACQPYKLKNCV